VLPWGEKSKEDEYGLGVTFENAICSVSEFFLAIYKDSFYSVRALIKVVLL